MKDTQYVKGTSALRADILDFGNYVFSQAHAPHDFRRLLPKVYGAHIQGMEDIHFLALQEGRIRGMMALLPQEMHVLDLVLKTGFVGTVSVHPYSRGEGHMKRLMSMLLEDAKEQQMDLLILGGQRQRYNYFGFENAGQVLRFSISSTNVRHSLAQVSTEGIAFEAVTEEKNEALDFIASLYPRQAVYTLRPRERLMDCLRSWNSDCHLIRLHGDMVGYIVGNDGEIRLTDEALLPAVIKAWMAWRSLEHISLRAAPWERERIALLAPIGENVSVSSCEMVRILRWPRVLQAMLRLKAACQPLMDGRAVLKIGDHLPLVIEVTGSTPAVREDASAVPDLTLSQLDAERLVFGMEQLFCPHPVLNNWIPLPFWISSVDGF